MDVDVDLAVCLNIVLCLYVENKSLLHKFLNSVCQYILYISNNVRAMHGPEFL